MAAISTVVIFVKRVVALFATVNVAITCYVWPNIIGSAKVGNGTETVTAYGSSVDESGALCRGALLPKGRTFYQTGGTDYSDLYSLALNASNADATYSGRYLQPCAGLTLLCIKT